MNNIQS